MWLKDQALDTDAWVAASGKILADDEVRSAVAVHLVDELFDNVDVSGGVSNAASDSALDTELGTTLAPLIASVGPLVEGALRDVSVEVADRVLASSSVQQLWEGTNRVAHTALLALLDDEQVEGVTVENDAVILELEPLIAQLASDLGIDVSAADLPDDFGQIVVAEDTDLSTVQAAVKVIRVMSSLLVLIVLGLFGLAIYLARGQRRRILLACASSLLLVGVVLLVVRAIGGDAIVEALTDTEAQIEPMGAVWAIATELLVNVATALIAYGAVVLIGAWLAGPARPAVAIRRFLAPTFRDHPVAVYVATVGVLLLILLWSPSDRNSEIAGTLVLFGLILLGVEALRRKTVREFPDADDRELGATPQAS